MLNKYDDRIQFKPHVMNVKFLWCIPALTNRLLIKDYFDFHKMRVGLCPSSGENIG